MCTFSLHQSCTDVPRRCSMLAVPCENQFECPEFKVRFSHHAVETLGGKMASMYLHTYASKTKLKGYGGQTHICMAETHKIGVDGEAEIRRTNMTETPSKHIHENVLPIVSSLVAFWNESASVNEKAYPFHHVGHPSLPYLSQVVIRVEGEEHVCLPYRHLYPYPYRHPCH